MQAAVETMTWPTIPRPAKTQTVVIHNKPAGLDVVGLDISSMTTLVASKIFATSMMRVALCATTKASSSNAKRPSCMVPGSGNNAKRKSFTNPRSPNAAKRDASTNPDAANTVRLNTSENAVSCKLAKDNTCFQTLVHQARSTRLFYKAHPASCRTLFFCERVPDMIDIPKP